MLLAVYSTGGSIEENYLDSSTNSTYSHAINHVEFKERCYVSRTEGLVRMAVLKLFLVNQASTINVRWCALIIMFYK